MENSSDEEFGQDTAPDSFDTSINERKRHDGFGKISKAAVFDCRLSAHNLRVLAALASFADREGTCFPSQKTVADLLGISRTALQRHIEALESSGYLAIFKEKIGQNKYNSNFYRLLYPPMPVLAPPEASKLRQAAMARRRLECAERFSKRR